MANTPRNIEYQTGFFSPGQEMHKSYFLKKQLNIYRQFNYYLKEYLFLTKEEIYFEPKPILKNDLVLFHSYHFNLDGVKYFKVTVYTYNKELSPDGNPIEGFIVNPNADDFTTEPESNVVDEDELINELIDEIISININIYDKVNRSATIVVNAISESLNLNLRTYKDIANEFELKRNTVNNIIPISLITELYDLIRSLYDAESCFSNTDLFADLKSYLPDGTYSDHYSFNLMRDRIGVYYKTKGITNASNFLLTTDLKYTNWNKSQLIEFLYMFIEMNKKTLSKAANYLSRIDVYKNVVTSNPPVTPGNGTPNPPVIPDQFDEDGEVNQGGGNDTPLVTKKTSTALPIILTVLGVLRLFK